MSEHNYQETSLELGYGARLRAEREAREISIDEVCRQLNLSRKVVVAVEAEDQGSLPAPAFVRGYLRSYARMLGLDGDALVAEYNSRGSADPIPGSMTSIGEQPRSDHPLMRWATILIIVLILAMLGAWLLTRDGGLSGMLGSGGDASSNSAASVPQPAAVSPIGAKPAITAPKPLVIAASEPGAAGEGGTTADEREANGVAITEPKNAPGESAAEVAADGDSTPATEAASAGVTAPAAVAAEAVATVAASGDAEAEPADEADSEAPPAIALEPAAAAGIVAAVDEQPEPEIVDADDNQADQRLLSSGEDVLELSAAEDSWVEISDAIGNRLMFDMLRGGERRSLRGTAPFRVFLGNAPPVSLTVNGSGVDRPRVSSRNTARFVVEADGSQHR